MTYPPQGNNIDASQVISGYFPLERMPRGDYGKALVGNGLNLDPFFMRFARTTTYVVAAPNAPAHVKAQADYVDIQTAIDALTAGRTWIETVKCIGSFTLSAAIRGNENNSYTRLDLSEAKLTLADGSNDNVIEFIPSGACAAGDITDIEIIGGEIDANRANNTGDGADSGNGITLMYVDRFKIMGTFVHDTCTHAIAIYGCRHGEIAHNFCLEGEKSHGIDTDYMARGGGGAVACDDIDIHDNILIDQGYSGIKTENNKNIRIHDNYVLQTQIMQGTRRGCGIDLSIDPIPAFTQSGILVANNIVESCFINYLFDHIGGQTVVRDNISITPVRETSNASGFLVISISSPSIVLTLDGNVSYGDGTNTAYGLTLNNVAGGVAIRNFTAIGHSADASAGIGFMGTCSDILIDGTTLRGNYYNTLFASGSSLTNIEFWNMDWSESVSANFYSYANGSGIFFRNGTVKNANTAGIGAYGFVFRSGNLSNITWNNCRITDDQTPKTQTYAFLIHGDYTGTTWMILDSNLSGNSTGVFNGTIPASSKILRNEGYVASGEIRTASGLLTAGVANAICFAWHNSEAQDIHIRKVVVEVTTAGGTAGSHLDVGIADDATGTNRGTEFFNDLLLNSVQINDSWVVGDGGTQTKFVFCQDLASAVDGWIVGQILTQNAASLVGRYYIEYVGR